jgi:fused signal recognition particle receptor
MNDVAPILLLVVFVGGFLALVGAYVVRTRAKKRELAEGAKAELPTASATPGVVVPTHAAQKGAEAHDAILAAERDVLSREVEEARARRDREQLEKTAADASAIDAARAREEGARAEAQKARHRAAELSHALTKTREGFVDRMKKAMGGRAIDESIVEELEAILFTSDIGVKTAEKLLERVRMRLKAKELESAARVTETLRDEIIQIFKQADKGPFNLDGDKPRVVMIIGVNGAGKTTTIGKLTHRITEMGKSVLLGAGDTFRAAATEQLAIWGERNQVPVVKGREGADPASVLFDAVERAKKDGVDVVLCDTAGRLHTKVNLMEELKKVQRVLTKAMPGAPHEVLLVLDATVGQNAIAQAKQFGEAVPITGIVLTKLDGTAKGGVVIGIAAELGVPVRFIGVGEKLDDLRPFVAEEFVDALFGSVDEVRSAA